MAIILVHRVVPGKLLGFWRRNGFTQKKQCADEIKKNT